MTDLIRAVSGTLGAGKFKFCRPLDEGGRRVRTSVGFFFDAQHASRRAGRQYLLIGIAPTTDIKQRIKRRADIASAEYPPDYLPGGSKHHRRLSTRDYWYGAEQRNSHAVALRFPINEPPQLCDSGRKKIWALTLARLDCSLHRVTGVFEVAEMPLLEAAELGVLLKSALQVTP